MTSFSPQVSRVKGISDKRRLPRLGKIRLGIKKTAKNGKEYPAETDYFVCPPEVEEVFGKEPKELRIMFPINEPEAVFPQAYTFYGASRGVKCKGDGETAYVYHSVCTGNCFDHEASIKRGDIWHERKCPCTLLDKKQCSLSGHLMFMLPDVSLGGVYQMDTGSYHSIVDVNSGIDYVRGVMQQVIGQDRFALIPLLLIRKPRKTGGGDTEAMQTHYTLNLHLPNNVDLKQLGGYRNMANLALPEPIEENPALDAVTHEEPEAPVVEPEVETPVQIDCPDNMEPQSMEDCDKCEKRPGCPAHE